MANWFAYDGFGNPFLPGSYLRTFVKPSCVSGGTIICAVYLDDNSSSSPSSITSVLNYIVETKVTMVPQPANGSKPFVYVRTCF